MIPEMFLRPVPFAEDYLKRKIKLPGFFDIPIANRPLYKDRFLLDSIDQLRLDRKIEDKIYRSLYEFRKAIGSSEDAHWQKKNKMIVKLRKDTIKFLEKALEYPYLTDKTRKRLLIEIERLKYIDRLKLDRISGAYHPLQELVVLSERAHLFVKLVEKTISSDTFSEKMSKIVETVPLKTSKGRPQKIFFKALQVVIFRLLNEDAGIPIEKAKKLTAKIINEYFSKFRSELYEFSHDPTYCNLKSKDIENALHGS